MLALVRQLSLAFRTQNSVCVTNSFDNNQNIFLFLFLQKPKMLHLKLKIVCQKNQTKSKKTTILSKSKSKKITKQQQTHVKLNPTTWQRQQQPNNNNPTTTCSPHRCGRWPVMIFRRWFRHIFSAAAVNIRCMWHGPMRWVSVLLQWMLTNRNPTYPCSPPHPPNWAASPRPSRSQRSRKRLWHASPTISWRSHWSVRWLSQHHAYTKKKRKNKNTKKKYQYKIPLLGV